MRFLILALVIATLTVSQAFAEFPTKIKVGDKDFPYRTVAEIRKLGFEVEDVSWKDNAARLYIDAMNLCQEPTDALEEVLKEGAETLHFTGHEKEVAAHFKRSQRAFDLIVQADGMRFVAPMGKASSLIGTMLPELGGYMRLFREITYRAAWDFSRGRRREAVDTCLLGIRMGRRVGKGYSLVAYLVGLGGQHYVFKTLEPMVASGKMDDAMLKRVAEGLANARAIPDTCKRALHCERLLDLDVVRVVAESKPEEVVEMRRLLKLPADTKFDFDASRKALGTVHDFITKWCAQPPTEAFKPENHPDDFVKRDALGKDVFVRTLIPAVAKVRLASIRTGILFDVAQMRIALERYNLAHKRYPDKLDALTPKYLAKVPADPFSGKPYRYERSRVYGFRIWSIGEDLTDDEGDSDEDTPWSGPDYEFLGKPGP